jgi:BlaI family penicillinase repressor
MKKLPTPEEPGTSDHWPFFAREVDKIRVKIFVAFIDYNCNLYAITKVIVRNASMKRMPRISETEWEVMNVLWSQAPCSAGAIIEALLLTDASWHPRTVKAFLNRLVKKKVLGFSKEGRAYVYRPLVRREECVDAASESFLERVFGGSLKPMLVHFVRREKLSAEEIRELRRLLKNPE